MTWPLFLILLTFWTLYGMGMVWRRWLASPDLPSHLTATIHAARAPAPAPELPDDPSAFWRYPDWDSGPIEQPFWMRPLKTPERKRDVIDVAQDRGMLMYQQAMGGLFGGAAAARAQSMYMAERNRAYFRPYVRFDSSEVFSAMSGIGIGSKVW